MLQSTYIPAFLAARTPAGASSKTRMLEGSTGPPYWHQFIINYNITMDYRLDKIRNTIIKWTQCQIQSRKRKGVSNLLIYGQSCQQVHHIHILVYLKSLGCCKKSIRRRFALFNFWVITKNNMMHQREDFMMSLSFQFKMSLVRTVGKISKQLCITNSSK